MVSIIVPVYKVEQYLRDCVDSILNQTYRDIQVILVDDGSPDGCGVICDAYAEKDSRVLALHKENGGVSSARNLGLEYAEGEYLTFCDSDDLYMPDWIEMLVTAMETSGADAVVASHIRFYEDGTEEHKIIQNTGLHPFAADAEKNEYIFNQMLTPAHGWEIWSRLFRTDIVRTHGLRFCESCGNFAEDLGFTLMYLLYAGSTAAVDWPGYRYRIRSSSMMGKSTYNPKLGSLQTVCEYCYQTVCDVFAPETAEQFYNDLQFFLLGNQVASNLWASGMEPDVFRKFVISSVPNWPETETRIRRLLQQKKDRCSIIPKSRKAEITGHLKFLLGMPWNMLRLQCKLIRVFRPLLDRQKR